VVKVCGVVLMVVFVKLWVVVVLVVVKLWL